MVRTQTYKNNTYSRERKGSIYKNKPTIVRYTAYTLTSIGHVAGQYIILYNIYKFSAATIGGGLFR